MFKTLFSAALASAATASLVYSPDSNSPQAIVAINKATLAAMSVSQSDWDAIVARISAKDGSASAADVQKYGEYTAEFAKQKEKWSVDNKVVPTAQELEDIKRLATESLTADQQTKLIAYNDAIKAGTAPDAEATQAFQAFQAAE